VGPAGRHDRGRTLTDLPFDVQSLHAGYAQGLSPVEVAATALDRIARAGDPGIFLHIAPKAALLAEAERLGPFDPVARPLWGVPFAVKDNIDRRRRPAPPTPIGPNATQRL